jgi:outer membrane protein assembly factor BamB
LGALFAGFKNQLVRINAANGEVIWDTTFVGSIEKELVTRRAIIDLWIKGDKIYMYLNGLMVFNYNSGQKLWESIYENDMEKSSGGLIGTKKRTEIYHTLAEPLFTDKEVYIVIFGKRDKTKYIEKHDLETGKLLWTSEKIVGAFCMPHIHKAGKKLIVQVGGKVQVQELRFEESSAGMGLSAGLALGGFGGGGGAKQWVPYIFWDYKNQKNGILALNDNDEKTAWRSEN